MKLMDLVVEISRAFVEERHPQQLDVFDEYAEIWASDLGEQPSSQDCERFGPAEVLGVVVVPIVLGVVSNLLYGLLKSRLAPKESRKEEIEPARLLEVVREEKELKRIVRRLKRRTRRADLVVEIVSYSLTYVGVRYARGATGTHDKHPGTGSI